MPFQGEDVFAGPEDRFDSLTDRSEARTVTGLIRAVRPHERDTALGGLRGELTAGVSPYLPAGSRRRDGANGPAASAPVSRSASFRGAQLKRVGRAVRGEHRVQAHPPEISRMRGNSGNKYRSRLPATARNLQSDATPMIARAVQSVTTSASVTLLFLAHHLFHIGLQSSGSPAATLRAISVSGTDTAPGEAGSKLPGDSGANPALPSGFPPARALGVSTWRGVAWARRSAHPCPPAAEIVGAARRWGCSGDGVAEGAASVRPRGIDPRYLSGSDLARNVDRVRSPSGT
jgi:hypothetical protein